MIKLHNQEQLDEERVDLALTSQPQYTMKGSQDRSVEAGTEAEAMEKHCLLACSPWLAQPVFKYNA